MCNAPPPPRPEPTPAATPESTPGAEAVLARARLLQDDAGGAQRQGLLLRGKNLGLIAETEAGADALRFRSAATALGANVSHVRAAPATADAPAGAGLLETARVLGRLYDGIECQGLTPVLVRQLGLKTGVPVFALAAASHPAAGLGPRLAGAGSAEDKQQLVLQAVLLLALE